MRKDAFNPESLRIFLRDSVYPPAEDSYLLARYAHSLRGRMLEIGCGSGIVSLSAALANPKNKIVGADINPEAVNCARKNAKANRITNCEFLVSDLFSSVSGKFDAILFNPPYLPTSRGERLASKRANAAYDGGESGLEVFFRFSKEVPSHIRPSGKIAVIATSLNDGIEKTLAELESRSGSARIVREEAFFFEKLALIEAVKE